MSPNGKRWTGCREVQKRGAGEIVLNMMNQDGVRNGYDLEQLKKSPRGLPRAADCLRRCGHHGALPGAFRDANVDGALAASVFHKQIIILVS